MSIEATFSSIAESLAKIATEGIHLDVAPAPTEPVVVPDDGKVETTPAAPAAPAKGKRGKKPAATKPTETKPAATEPAATEPDKGEPDGEQGATADDVREALRAFMKGSDPETAKAILEKHGASSVTALKPESYAAVVAEFTGAPVDPSDLD